MTTKLTTTQSGALTKLAAGTKKADEKRVARCHTPFPPVKLGGTAQRFCQLWREDHDHLFVDNEKTMTEYVDYEKSDFIEWMKRRWQQHELDLDPLRLGFNPLPEDPPVKRKPDAIYVSNRINKIVPQINSVAKRGYGGHPKFKIERKHSGWRIWMGWSVVSQTGKRCVFGIESLLKAAQEESERMFRTALNEYPTDGLDAEEKRIVEDKLGQARKFSRAMVNGLLGHLEPIREPLEESLDEVIDYIRQCKGIENGGPTPLEIEE